MDPPRATAAESQTKMDILHSSKSSLEILNKFLTLLENVEDKREASSVNKSEVEKSMDSCLNYEDTDEDKLLFILKNAQENLSLKELAEPLILNLCSYIQIVSDGLTHWIHRKQIYKENLDAAAQFLRTLIQVCSKVADGCRTYFELNWTAETSESLNSSPNELIGATISALKLGTENGNVIPCVARFFMLLVKHFKSKMTTPYDFCSELLTHLDGLVYILVSKSQETGNRESDVKRINYFGKIVERYCSLFTLTSSWTPCFSHVIQIARSIEVNALELDVSLFYPQILNSFFALGFSMSDFEDALKNWPGKCRIKFKLKLIKLANFRHRDLGLALSSTLTDVMLCSAELKDKEEMVIFQKFIDEEVLPLFSEIIRSLSSTEFDVFQDTLLTFLIEREAQCCFLTWYLIADIFGFITQLAPDELVEEYLHFFSKSNMPPSIKYFILPEVFKYSRTQTFQNRDSDILQIVLINILGMQEQIKAENTIGVPEAKCIKLFWSRHKARWSSNFAKKILPICVEMVEVFPYLDKDSISVILVVLQEQLRREPVPPFSLIAVSMLLRGFQYRSFKSCSKEWEILSTVCTKLLDQCLLKTNCQSFPKPARYFVVKSFCAFLSQVDVESEEMLESVRPSDWEETQGETWTKYLRRLENCAQEMEEKNLEISIEDRYKLKAVLSRLDAFCQDRNIENGSDMEEDVGRDGKFGRPGK